MFDKNTQTSKKKKNIQKSYPFVLTPKRVIYRLRQYFSKVPESRRDNGGHFRYKMSDFIIAVILAIVRGCPTEGDAIVTYWKANKDFLHSLGLFENKEAKNNVPAIASYYRMAAVLDSKIFKEQLFKLVTEVSIKNIRRGLNVLAVDGKKMCGTSCGELGRPIHILTAFCSALSIPINCVSCSEKSNEITAWEQLLELLGDLCRGMTFTSDAMGCQTHIVKEIIGKQANYCLALKGNHPNFEREAKDMIARGINFCESYTEMETLSHGRIEQRTCRVYKAIPGDKNSYITGLEKWEGIRRIIHINAHRIDKKTGKESSDERIYISNLEENAQNFNTIIRSHWSVEVFHHVLDTDFKQDSIKRSNDETTKASKNLDLFQKAAYIMLKLYDLLLSKLNKERKPLGIKKMLNRCNASNKMIEEICNLDLSWLDVS